MANITQEQALALFVSGAPVLQCAYMGSKAETISWRDKSSGKSMSAPILRHTCLLDGQALSVTERVDEKTFTPESYRSPFKQGQKVLVRFTEFLQQRGLLTARGELIAIA